MTPLRRWLFGLALSFGVAWAAGALLLDTVQPIALDPAVGRYMPLPGTVMRQRSEGFATTAAGEHGLRGLPGGALPQGPKVVFWGDSYVEALQVDDEAHMDRVFAGLAERSGLPLTAAALGVSGDSILDSIFRLPQYAAVFAPVALHVFLVAKASDILPDLPHPGHCEFWTLPAPHLTYASAQYSPLHLRFGPLVRSLELAGPYRPVRLAMAASLRFAPGPERGAAAPPPPETTRPDMARLRPAWDFLLGELVRRAAEPMLIVFVPTLPRLDRGRVSLDEPDAPLLRAFAQACARRGVGFLDMGPAFAAHYQATGRFPRGFFNSPPGQGHLNADGHRLVAEAVLRHVLEHRDALLAR